MRPNSVLALLALLTASCTGGGGGARDPSKPTPVAGPGPGTATVPTPQREEGSGEPEEPNPVPTRPEQAPLVTVSQIVGGDIVFGRRVRVAGRCVAAGQGRSAGSWTLAEDEAQIEVRGLVPAACRRASSDTLTIFAQVEPKEPGSREPLLLRLPD
jgi:hypothetical protein